MAFVSSVEVVKTNLVSGDNAREHLHKVKLWDKRRALEMLARHIKLIEDSLHVGVDMTDVIERLQAARTAVQCLRRDSSAVRPQMVDLHEGRI